MVLTDPGSGYPFVGMKNYIKIFQDERALHSIGFTLKFTITTVVFELVIGFAAALIMNKAFRGKGLVRAAIFDSVGDSDISISTNVEIYL